MDHLTNPSIQVGGQKRALIVGISYEGQTSPLGGHPTTFQLSSVRKDIQILQDSLISQYGYLAENIKILTDDGKHIMPTKDNILAAMKDFVNAQAGDSLFFFYVGHGYQKRSFDPPERERDGKDEFIIPDDWNPKESPDVDDWNVIIDNEIKEILVENLPQGCKLTALWDTCHSGTIMDLTHSRSCCLKFYKEDKEDNDKQIWHDSYDVLECTAPDCRHSQYYHEGDSPSMPADQGDGSRLLDTATATTAGCPLKTGNWVIKGESIDDGVPPPDDWARVISWSACSDAQEGSASKSKVPNRAGGLMLRAFVEILDESPKRTYKDILTCLGLRLRQDCLKRHRQNCLKRHTTGPPIRQEPQLGSEGKPNLDDIFSP